jgi:hypothetical protein
MATEPLIELGSNYELDEDSNGNLVIRDTNGNAVLTYDNGKSRWALAQDIVPETSGTEQLGATGKAFGQLVSNAVGNDGSRLSVDDDLDLQSAQSITNASSVSTESASINQTLTDPDGVDHTTKLVSVESWNIQPAYTSGPSHGEGGTAFQGAAPAPDGRVILAPTYSSNVGIFDPATDTYTSGPSHGEGGAAFVGAAPAPDGRVILAPFDSDNVGIISPYTPTQFPAGANR